MRMTRVRGLLVVMTALCACAGASGEEISLPAVRDVWICGEGTMRDTSMSRTHTLKLEGGRDAALLDFDRIRLQGMRISKAELFLHRAEPAKDNTPGASVVVSTVSGQWVEGRFSIPYRKDPVGRGATFNQAAFGVTPWTVEKSTVMDAVMGKGNTLVCRAAPQPTVDEWYKVKLDREVVHALAAGASFGIFVTVETGRNAPGWLIHSRESGKYAPYLRVQAKAEKRGPPATPSDLKIEPAGTEPGHPRGTLSISFRVPEGTFAYEVSVGEKQSPRWLIPFAAKAGTTQRFTVPGVEGDRGVKVNVWAVAADGRESDAAEAGLPGPPPRPKNAID